MKLDNNSSTPSLYRTLVVAPGQLFRAAIAALVREANFNTVTEASDLRAALDVVRQPPSLDLILAWHSVFFTEAFGFLEETRTMAPDVKIVVLGDHRARPFAHDLLGLGIDGLLETNVSPKELAGYVDLVMLGERVVQFLFSAATGLDTTGQPLAPARKGPLSRRELHIVRHLARGECNKEIARKLGLVDGTVKNHVSSIKKKLNARNRTEIAVWTHQNGWLGLSR